MRPLKKTLGKTDKRAGEGVTFDRALEIVRIILELRSQIRSLVPMRIGKKAIMQIFAASKKCGLLWSVPILRPNNADIIRILEFVKGVKL